MPLRDSKNFKRWVVYVFETDKEAPQTTHDGEEGPVRLIEPPPLEPLVTVNYLTEVFSNAAELLKSYSNAQVCQGLLFLGSNSYSDTIFALLDESVPWPQRQLCIQSMYTLYTRFFRLRCSPELSFPPERTLKNPLNFVSCHWFDLLPMHNLPDVALNREFLDVFRRLLATDSIICREGALTGLGTRMSYRTEEAGEIIDNFLGNTPRISPRLKELALLAKQGLNIL